MSQAQAPVSFMTAARQFFGLLPGQTPIQFGKEVKALTPEDRAELIPGIESALGCTIMQQEHVLKAAA